MFLAALIATLLDRAVLYLRTPAPGPGLQPWPGAANDPRELHALHHEPSEAFCAADPPLVCAHGGDSSDGAPPNTLEAFQAALQQGVPCLEVDVARTSDGQLVVLHPRDLAQLLLGSAPGSGSSASAGSNGGGSGAAEQAGTCSAGAGTCDAAADAAQQPDQQQEPLPKVGDYTWAELAALRWPGGQGVATAEDVLRLAVPTAQHITLDARAHTSKVRGSIGLHSRPVEEAGLHFSSACG